MNEKKKVLILLLSNQVSDHKSQLLFIILFQAPFPTPKIKQNKANQKPNLECVLQLLIHCNKSHTH